MGNRGGMPGDVLLLNSRPSSSAKNNLNSTSFISMNRTQRIYQARALRRAESARAVTGRRCPHSALCCYSNVNGSVRNLSLNISIAPFFCYSIISEKIFGLQFGRSFIFFHICTS